mgnify:CR=1 FL=1
MGFIGVVEWEKCNINELTLGKFTACVTFESNYTSLEQPTTIILFY